MPAAILSRHVLRQLIRERKRTGAYRHDEVWNGVYVMSPDADNQHQRLAGDFYRVFWDALHEIDGVNIYPTINISDREEDWRKNFRIPDASVFLPGNPAQDRGTHWLGGPDFAVEIVSPGDRSRKKFDFYGAVGIRELLIVERRPWRLELYRHQSDGWTLVGTSTAAEPVVLVSEVLPLSFRMLPGERRPWIEVKTLDGTRTWTI